MALSIQHFPSLSTQEFEQCCENLQKDLQRYQGRYFESVEMRKELGQCYMRLKRFFETAPTNGDGLCERNDEIEGGVEDIEDDKDVTKTVPCPGFLVEYYIILSPIYQVPVLYFVSSELPTAQSVYEKLVPDDRHDELNYSLVMGSISFGENPINHLSMFFLHPCNTAHAMYEIGPGLAGTPLKYLTFWMGIVASCVSLHVPFDDKYH